MNFQPVKTLIVCGILVIVILLWDLLLYLDKVPRNDISQAITDLDKRHRWFRLVVGAAFGFLLGHWFPS